MLDIRHLRENPELVRKALQDRGEDFPLDEVIELDRERRCLLQDIEGLRSRQNRLGKLVGQAKRAQSPEEVEAVVCQARDMGVPLQGFSDSHEDIASLLVRWARDTIPSQIEEREKGLPKIEQKLQESMLRLANIPDPSVPVGHEEKDSPIVRTWGKPRDFTFRPLPHWDLGPRLGIIDFERGVKLSGTRFYVLFGLGSLLQRSLINFMLNLHTQEHGYKEVYPPFMVKEYCMVGSGNLPRFGDNLYHDAEEDFWFVPTAEVPLTNLHRDEVLEPGVLPLHYVAYTACFRREKMAAGRETRGLKRGHQFDKVELYKFTEPERSDEELEAMVRDAEEVCQRLGTPYRVKLLCTGELGFASCKSYDIEMWAPGMGEWLEVSSCSNCGDFQARRANIRYRPSPGARPRFVHTLNGSGLALPRVVAALLENYQQPDGSVLVPEALKDYLKVEAIARV